MSFNRTYRSIADLPKIIPIFPLGGALLLPRGDLPLNIFEPRYLAMVDAAMTGPRLIGMVQPSSDKPGSAPALAKVGCLGRITQLAEMGDGRYHLVLTGVCRFGVAEEPVVATAFRQCRADYQDYAADLAADLAEDQVNRAGVIAALRQFADAHSLQVDWESIESASNESLVNALSMMAPFGLQEKQALLEAHDLPARAEMLIAISQMDMARTGASSGALQ